MKHLLIVGSTRLGALEDAYARAFTRQGVHVTRFDSEAPVKALLRDRIVSRLTRPAQFQLVGRALHAFLRESGQAFDSILVFKGMWLTRRWIERCQRLTGGAMWINLNPDDPFNLAWRGATNRNVVESVGLFSVYAIWAQHLMAPLREAGCPCVVHLPFGFDSDHHFPSPETDPSWTNVVSFVGTWDTYREAALTEIAEFPLRICGNGWERISADSPLRGKTQPGNVYGAALRQAIGSSRASLNILRPQNLGAHNMRTFEIPAMRGAMLANYSDEQNGFFPHGQAALLFRDGADLRRQMEEVLSPAFPVEELKAAAREACQGHSYDDRARALRETIEEVAKEART